MWPPWMRSPSRAHTTSTLARTTRNFSCSSFKDIQALLNEESLPEPNHPKKPSIFHRVRISTSILRAWTSRLPFHSDPSPKPEPDAPFSVPNSEHLIIVYFTSLRIVRKTFQDCRTVRSILRGFRVSIDERDVSMDASFLHELKRILGRKCVTLPSVFISGRYVGGAEEIRRLHESDELKELIGRYPMVRHTVCDACDGHRFIVCEVCNGSRKVYVEKSRFRSCTDCNVNGLIKCPSCSLHTPSKKGIITLVTPKKGLNGKAQF